MRRWQWLLELWIDVCNLQQMEEVGKNRAVVSACGQGQLAEMVGGGQGCCSGRFNGRTGARWVDRGDDEKCVVRGDDEAK